MTTTSLPTQSLRRPRQAIGQLDSALTSNDVLARTLCGSCAGCPRAALRAGTVERV